MSTQVLERVFDRIETAPNRELPLSPGPDPQIGTSDWRAAMQSTEWRPAVGYEGRYAQRYEVSSAGGVRTVAGRVLSQARDKDGYCTVSLQWDGRSHRVRVHRLVAMAFIAPPTEAQHLVRHLDDNPENNVPDNLAWGTTLDNVTDKMLHGRHRNQYMGRTHCSHGHEYTEANTRLDGTRRTCRTCKRHDSQVFRMAHSSEHCHAAPTETRGINRSGGVRVQVGQSDDGNKLGPQTGVQRTAQ